MFIVAVVLVATFFVACDALSGWTYEATSSSCAGTDADPCGPVYWSKVNGAGSCGLDSQSPINLVNVPAAFNLSYPHLTSLEGGCPSWVQFSNNYTFEVGLIESKDNIYCSNLYLTYGTGTFYLQQIHFHSPSEHSIGGGYYAAEAHMVHVNPETSQKLVLGVFMQEAAFDNMAPSNNSFLNLLWTAGGQATLRGEEVVVEELVSSAAPGAALSLFNPYTAFLPARSTHYQYNGSLTVPPCSENVQWIVFDEAVPISRDDLSILRSAIGALKTAKLSSSGNSNRVPSQPVNGRSVYRVDPALNSLYAQLSAASASDDDSNTDSVARDKAHEAVALSASALTISILAAAVTVVLANFTFRHVNPFPRSWSNKV